MKTFLPNFFSRLFLVFPFSVLLLGLFSSNSLTAQNNCSLSCNSFSQLSLDANCDTEVTWEMIVNAKTTACPDGEFEVKVSKYKNGPAIPSSPYVTKANINETLTVEVMDINSRNKCWGMVTVEDKMPPRITCENDTLYCFEMRNYAGPLATDNCQKAGFLHARAEPLGTNYGTGPSFYPWGGGFNYDDYTTSMDKIFGQGNWDDLFYEILDPEVVFSKAYCVLYLEGSDAHAIELSNFLNNNRALIEQWVADGGKLLINAAPNEGGDINFGFGGFVLDYIPFQGDLNVSAVDPTHPIWNGPNMPVALNMQGTRYNHAVICPQNIGAVPIIFGEDNQRDVLVEYAYGDGLVLFGGMTASGFHSPQPNARNVKWNILEYLKNYGGADVELTMLNEKIVPISCDENYVKKITRTYIATDAQGNQSQPCTYDIYLKRFPQENLVWPQEYLVSEGTSLECSQVQRDGDDAPDPLVYGVPEIDGISLYPNNDFYCNVAVTYKDVTLSVRNCVTRIGRAWTVREWWCSENVDTLFTQIIEIEDSKGPEFVIPDSMNVTTSGRTCEARVTLPIPSVFDSCSLNDVTLDITANKVHKNVTSPISVWLPVGVNYIEYTAYDACYNPTTKYMKVVVSDNTPPVAICDQHTVVGITYDGYADVFTQTFDDGSYDDCWIDSMAVRRMNNNENCEPMSSEFGPFVTFCCDDVGEDGLIVVLRVWDENGNSADCMIEVAVQDKIAPEITCPPHLTISCDYYLDRTDLSDFGTVVKEPAQPNPLALSGQYIVGMSGPLLDGTAHDNCAFEIQVDSSFAINNCNVGTIERTFTAIDSNGIAPCTQIIEIINTDPFTINQNNPLDPTDDIIWPLNLDTLSACVLDSFVPADLPFEHGRPQFLGEDKCDLVEAIYNDEQYSFSGNGACYKIIRTWKVIDWCQPDPTGNGSMEWTYEQVIKVSNLVAPEILSGCDPVTAETTDSLCQGGQIELIATAMDSCTPPEFLQWSYEVDTLSKGVFGQKVTGFGDTIDASGFYPIGTHLIKYSFEDRCGNRSTCTSQFTIINKKAPTITCHNGIIVNLSPIVDPMSGDTIGGEIEVWASDLIDTAYHTCGYDLTYSFDSLGLDSFVLYNCDSMSTYPDTFDVVVYVTDTVGNQTSCTNFIIVQDNEAFCPNNNTVRMLVGGRILTEDKREISEVQVSLQGSGLTSFVTDNDGLYAFPPMATGANYVVVPEKNKDYLNGVSTADLIEIQRHLLGNGNLDSPYKLIAADANGSGDISAKDVLELRRLILGISDDLPVPSWRFVDAQYQFSDPADPFSTAWPEEYAIQGLNQNMSIDFTGIKVGDVNETAKANANQKPEVRSRNIVKLYTWNEEYEYGDNIEIPVYDQGFEPLDGFQFTIEFDPVFMSLQDIIAGQIPLNDSHFGFTYLSEGLIAVSWDGSYVPRSNQPLFILSFKAQRSGTLNEKVFITSAITPAEAYSSDLGILGVELEVRNDPSRPTFTLYQNTPNPYKDETIIRYSLSNEQSITLSIYDMNGRLIIRKQTEGFKGMNQINVQSGELKGSGIYYYQIETESQSATRRMIMLE